MKKLCFPLLSLGLGVFFLASCSTSHNHIQDATAWDSPQMLKSTSSQKSATSSDNLARESSSPASRGVIGTGHGTHEYTDVKHVEFTRLNKKPDSLLVLDYRDESKADASSMARVSVLNDPHSWIGVRFLSDSWFSSTYPTYLTQGGRPMLLGERGKHYTIELENKTDSALEVVVSIDGLNTTTNKTATYASRGYIIGPHETVAVRGWTSGYGSYRFKFSDIDSTVAARSEGQANVPDIGTIGFAIFKSKASVNAATRGRAFADQ